MFLYVLVEDIKNLIKTDQQHSGFLTEYFGETLFRPQQMVAELGLIDPLLELTVGGVLELDVVLGVSRSES